MPRDGEETPILGDWLSPDDLQVQVMQDRRVAEVAQRTGSGVGWKFPHFMPHTSPTYHPDRD